MLKWNGTLSIYHLKNSKGERNLKKGSIVVPKILLKNIQESIRGDVIFDPTEKVHDKLKVLELLYYVFDKAIKQKNKAVINFIRSQLSERELEFLVVMSNVLGRASEL